MPRTTLGDSSSSGSRGVGCPAGDPALNRGSGRLSACSTLAGERQGSSYGLGRASGGGGGGGSSHGLGSASTTVAPFWKLLHNPLQKYRESLGLLSPPFLAGLGEVGVSHLWPAATRSSCSRSRAGRVGSGGSRCDGNDGGSCDGCCDCDSYCSCCGQGGNARGRGCAGEGCGCRSGCGCGCGSKGGGEGAMPGVGGAAGMKARGVSSSPWEVGLRDAYRATLSQVGELGECVVDRSLNQ